jgi:hypothetical protein
MLSESEVSRLRAHLSRLYGDERAAAALPRLVSMFEDFRPGSALRPGADGGGVDETDVVLSCYADQVVESGRPALATLRDFLARVRPGITGLHLLPLHPSTSDDGFAVADHTAVDPALGDWEDVGRLSADFRLMLDAVVNHTSASHPWFTGWLADDPRNRDFYHELDPATDLASVTRPRTSPLLTEVSPGRWAWTTFSADQVDVNYANPDVLLHVTEMLLRYVAHGARILRLDAVAFLWKRVGTSCMHLPETHEIVRFWRTVLDLAAPGTLVVTETNVPHAENVSYFGSGTDEAHLVYQFALPPLTLAAFRSGDVGPLGAWVRTLGTPSDRTTYLNFLGSHDGIGLRAAEGLLPASDIESLCRAVEANDGLVSYRRGPGGEPVPYELNSVYLDALRRGAGEPVDLVVDRFLAAHSVMLTLAGVPLLYFHSLLGSRNWGEGVARTGRARVVNRQRLTRGELERELADPTGLRRRVLDGLLGMIAVRAGTPAFHPDAGQSWVPGSSGCFAVQRTPRRGGASVVCVTDVTGRPGRFRGRPGDHLPGGTRLTDLRDGSEHVVEPDGTVDVPVAPYGVRWLAASGVTRTR